MNKNKIISRPKEVKNTQGKSITRQVATPRTSQPNRPVVAAKVVPPTADNEDFDFIEDPVGEQNIEIETVGGIFAEGSNGRTTQDEEFEDEELDIDDDNEDLELTHGVAPSNIVAPAEAEKRDPNEIRQSIFQRRAAKRLARESKDVTANVDPEMQYIIKAVTVDPYTTSRTRVPLNETTCRNCGYDASRIVGRNYDQVKKSPRLLSRAVELLQEHQDLGTCVQPPIVSAAELNREWLGR